MNYPLLRTLPPDFDDFAMEAMRTKALCLIKSGNETLGDKSDEWIASEIRMLMRGDLWHEAICIAARDRIMRLSLQVAELRGVVSALKERSARREEP